MTIKDFMKMEKPWEYNFECGDKNYKALSTFERYFTYKILPEATAYKEANEFIKDHLGYSPICDPDGSGEGYYTIIHEIYNALWGWKKDENSTFGTLEVEGKPDICQFGADTMNSVQTALGLTIEPNERGRRSSNWTLEWWCEKRESCENKWKSMGAEEYIKAYHTLGNFVLVPKGFNGYRGTKLSLCRNEETPGYAKNKKDGMYYKKVDDFWDLSLEYLYDNGFHKKINKSTVHFDEDSFEWYINYFFLWDYVEKNGKSYKPKHIGIKNGERDFTEFFKTSTKLILRRGKFMTAMLMLEQGDYQKLRSSLFDTDTIYEDFDDVIFKIEKEISQKKISLNDSIKAIMDGLKTRKE